MGWVDRLPDLLSEWVGNLAVLLSQWVVLVVALACGVMVARRPPVHTDRPSLVVFAAINVFGFLAALAMRAGLPIVDTWRLVLHPIASLVALLPLILVLVAAFVLGSVRELRRVRLGALVALVLVWLYVLLSWRVFSVLAGLVNLHRWLDWWSLGHVLAVVVAAIPFTACLAALRTDVRRAFPSPGRGPRASLAAASGSENRKDGRGA